ncbi:hypothetical protein DT076_12360 [Desertihabitans brevis]|uniref:Uncharacterized protein n=1 Tax=Desertihabitans brevis TaxID=2268447 RepID=A0A367YVY8_9ACTN|nr:heparinase II/III-family protein [Desertihabitans brevis]RCK69131.1 hypothetical protein DT076_12360 [Desertihabitans brevis]
MGSATSRLSMVRSFEPGVADGIWFQLVEAGSVRDGRPITWPIPNFLQAPDAAEVQAAEGYRAEPGFAPVAIPIDWGANPFRDRAWMNRLMCLQPMDAYVLAFRAGERRWLRPAADIYFSWCDYHLQQRQRAYMSWYDMPVGYRATKTAFLLSAVLEGDLEPSVDEQRVLVASAEAHLRELVRPDTLSHGNHGIFQMHGLAVLAQCFWALPDARPALDYARETMQYLVGRQFNDEGVHLEHSPKYHEWMMGELSDIAASGWHALDVAAVLERAEEVRGWFLEPDGGVVRIGDTASFRGWPPATVSTPDFANDRYQMRWFRKGGYAVARSADGQLFVQGSYHSRAHKHADDLSFELFDRGRRILVDSGAEGYGVGSARAYFLSTAAHNTVEVDAMSHPRDGTDAYGSSIQDVETRPDEVRVRAAVDHVSMDWRHERVLSWKPGQRLVLYDRLTSPRFRSFSFWLHLAPEFERLDDATFCDGEVHCVLECEAPYRWYRGTEDPMRGWRANGTDERLPAWSGCATVTAAQVYLRTIVRVSASCDCG